MEIFGEIEKWLADKTKYEAVNILKKFEVPCAPVLDMKELAYDRDLRESGTVVEVPHKQRGTYLTVGSPMKFSEFEPHITGSPLLGENTDEVLAQLGYSSEQIAKFHESKVVGPLPSEPGELGWDHTSHAAAAD
jgi:formyl-CoA transferase